MSVPEAWPLLMSREVACAYLMLSKDSFRRVCPVPALELGVNLLRWRRHDLDDWTSGLPLRLLRGQTECRAEASSIPPAQLAAEERRISAVERAKQRSRTSPTRKKRRTDASPLCSVSGARTG